MKAFLFLICLFTMIGHTSAMGSDYETAMKRLAEAQTELQRFHALGDAAMESFDVGKKEDAYKFALELSNMMEQYKKDWNYGNAVQYTNIVFGRIALTEGNIEKAKIHLLKAGDSCGSPQMNSFGPNMKLAKELLEKGETQCVLEYFKKCASFWKLNHGKLEEWTKQVEAGQIPNFGANLKY